MRTIDFVRAPYLGKSRKCYAREVLQFHYEDEEKQRFIWVKRSQLFLL